MPKEMVISANPHETRVAILEEGQLCEYYVERQKEFALVGSIYKGRVTRVLPGMQSAFVDIGLDGDAFLYVSDFLEDTEEFDHVVSTVVEKVEKMEEQGGQVFPAENSSAPALEPADVESAPVSGAIAEPEARQEVSGAPETAPPPPSYNSPPPERPRSENRHRDGRDFGRRGGRGGRFGRRGGRGGDRRYGRELPSSKYASPRAQEDQSAEQTPAGGYAPVILPGESFAKYREKAPSVAAPPVVSAEEAETASTLPIAETVQQAPAPPASPQPRPEFRSSAWGGLEPLPGETISKWSRREPLSEPQVQSDVHDSPSPQASQTSEAPGQDQPREETLLEREEDREREARLVHEAEIADEEHIAAELSEDEAAALAEHVAEAQIEEEAREAQRRDFAAEDAGQEPHEDAAEETNGDEAHETEELPPSEADADVDTPLSVSGAEPRPEPLEPPDSSLAESGEETSPAISEPLSQQPWQARVRGDSRSRMQYPNRRGRDRGRRDDRDRRPQHGFGRQGHRPQLISDLLKQGQEIIVQIAKEPLGKKGARITSHVALPGRFLVYMPTLNHTGVSRKIASAEDRARLRHLVNEAKGTAGGGFIVRTAAASAAPEEVRSDVEFLTKTWAEIKARSEQRKAPSLLHRDLNLMERILRDYVAGDYSAVWVDSEEEFTKVVDFMSRFQPALVNRVKLYTKETPIFEEFGIQQEIDKGLRPKVWLKSGGYIVINHTEALVAIDVNTGKFVGKGSTRLEDTIVRTNLEAVKEIVRQMRLRDLGGIIIIDFIDMEERRNREKVMAALEDALRADRAPSKMLRFNEFGLIAITRKRTKQALERTLCQPCPYCTGSGMVKSIPTLSYEIQTEARKMAPEIQSGSLTLRVHPEIAKALKTRESALVEELEQWTRKSVIIQADPTLHWEQYDIY